MSKKSKSPLRFNLGFLIEGDLGTSRIIELDYPAVQLDDDVCLSPLTGSFEVSRTSRGLYFSGLLTSNVDVECARCLEFSPMAIEIKLDDLFYYPPSSAPEGELVVGEDTFVDLGPLVRELSLLEIPIQHICREDCKGLCPECGKNLNEGTCDCVITKVDPRMSVLQELLQKQTPEQN